MNDRERVLMNIAVECAGSFYDRMHQLDGGWTLRIRFDRPAPQFIPEEAAESIGMPMQPGDIVRCKTNPHHPWGIAELVERTGYADFLLREIGGNRTCNMSNEMVDVLRFMPLSRLYTGTKYKLYQWATTKAFAKRYNPDADYFRRCGGAEFDGDTLIVWCRPHVFAYEKKGEGDTKLYAQPKKFTLPWSDKTRLSDIVQAMREQGFKDEFEYGPNEPTRGQAGTAVFTRDDLMRIIQSATPPADTGRTEAAEAARTRVAES